MKKNLFIIIIALSFILSNKHTFAEGGLMDNIGISLYGGAAVPISGEYTSNLKTTDMLDIGPKFGLGISYYFTEQLGIEGIFQYEYNYYKEKYRTPGMEPVRTNFAIDVNLIYFFNEMLREDFIRPFGRAGLGFYSWAYRDNGVSGEVSKVGNDDFKSVSFGFNIGAGADFKLLEDLTVGLVLDFNMFFPKDEKKFGYFFAEQGSLSPQLKVTYYIPTLIDDGVQF